MTLTQQVYAQALLLSGDLEQRQEELLKLLCGGAVNSLTARLREGLRPEDCMPWRHCLPRRIWNAS